MEDTDKDILKIQTEIFSQLPQEKRLEITFQLSSMAKNLSFNAIRKTNPEFSDEEIKIKFVELHYGKELAKDFGAYLLNSKKS